ncbi:xanthine dehydrogenase accessory factor [Yoonia maritima]|uniref:Xanthine dehydrogenase accessory factor n=1 Tax=Yoonia maritima TaxID=1435347 RepID=A0A2T0VT94_9RHOB|nr:XdhC family protein [Yoonia maritima]PRY74152.1 xanthine dehydrogenase accessory factor [Yoonia maritima]
MQNRQFLENAEDILAFVQDCQSAQISCALCVVTGVSGGSARSVGTLVAVRADGQMAGYVSHGCVDADLCVQAIDAINDGKQREVIYGVGSPFMDLRLPCGGTVNILIDPSPDHVKCKEALKRLMQRQAVTLVFSAGSGFVRLNLQHKVTGWDNGIFSASHVPALRLIIAGVGPPLAAVAQIAAAMNIEYHVLSPDEQAANYVSGTQRQSFKHLVIQDVSIDLELDAWTAVLVLFHDHDWEPNILEAALRGNPFYIGALGSARTHEQRIARLLSRGANKQDVSRIKGPIGVISAARDSYTLALSAITEIVDAYRG